MMAYCATYSKILGIFPILGLSGHIGENLTKIGHTRHMRHLVASSVHIPLLLAQCALIAQSSHSITEFLETADTVILLFKLDVSYHN